MKREYRRVALVFLLASAGACSGTPDVGSGSEPTPPVSADDVSFSPSGRTFSVPFELRLSTSVPGAEIYYTMDGSVPDSARSTLYSGPFQVDASVWVRARIVRADGVPGVTHSHPYIRLDSTLASFSSNLPLMVIDSFGRDVDAEAERERPYRPVMTVIVEPDSSTGRASIMGDPNYAGYGGMHVRGNSSVDYPKKQYKFETWDEFGNDQAQPLLGLPEEADWVIHAPYSDKTLMRNHLMYKWSNDLGRYAPRTRFVEVFITFDGQPIDMGDYRGVYVFMEKIKRDKARVAVDKLGDSDSSEPEISGGYLLKHDWEEEIDGFESDFTTSLYADRINYEYPRPEKISDSQKQWIRGYIDAFESSLATTTLAQGDAGYAGYIDVDSFADHMLLVELGRNVDGYVLSTFMHKPRAGKLTMGPIWDFNGALGNASYFDAALTAGWHYENDTFPEDNPQAFAWWNVLLQDPDFVTLRGNRWAQARMGPLSTARMLADIDATAALLQEAQSRNFQRWPVLGANVWPNDDGAEGRLTYEEEVAYLKQWIEARAVWLDSAASN